MTTQSRALRGVGPLVTAGRGHRPLTTVVQLGAGPAVGGGDHQSQSDRHGDPIWIDAWVRWDSNWYGGIAENGYFYHPGQQSLSPSSRPTRWRCVWSPGSSGTSGSPGSWSRCCGAASLVPLLAVARWPCHQSRPSARHRLPAAYPTPSSSMGRCTATPSSCSASWLLHRPRAGTSPSRSHRCRSRRRRLVAWPGRRTRRAHPRMLAQSTSGRDKVSSGAGKSPHHGCGHGIPSSACRSPPARVDGLSVVRLRQPVAFADAQSFFFFFFPGAGPRTWFKGRLGGQMLHGPWDIRRSLRAVLRLPLAVLAIPRFRRVGYLTYAVIVLGIPLVGSKDFLGCSRP